MPETSQPHAATALRLFALIVLLGTVVSAQAFFPLKDVRPGLRGIGRTIFHGNQIEEFQVEILGVLQNMTPQQSVILARLSGGPLAETGVMQGMSGSPVYIDGRLLGAIALGFPFSKEAIAGIQPIESMIAGASLRSAPTTRTVEAPLTRQLSWLKLPATPPSANVPSPFGNLSEILTPLSLSGFTPRTLEVFAPSLRSIGFDPEQGVSAGAPTSQSYSGTVSPGSMISVGLLTGDMNMTADGTVTYVDGKHVYAFGHRFLDIGSAELPFARSEVVAVVPNLASSFKVCSPREWVGTILSDRSTAIAGEIGRPAHTIPLSIALQSSSTGAHQYHFQVVNDRFLTPFITQTALFSALDASERTLGAGTLRLDGEVQFEGNLPALHIRDTFVSDSALPQQVSLDAVVSLAFVLGGGFADVHLKSMAFTLEQVESKRQLHLAQAWASRHEVHPGEPVEVTALLQGENGVEITRTATFRVPVGAPNGPLNFTLSDANTLNFPEFAGLSQSQLQDAARLIETINSFRESNAVYVRVWRPQPSFTISGPLPGGEITDPPPSAALIFADPSDSVTSNPALTATRGSQLAELNMPLAGWVVIGAKTIQVEVKE